jgi:hypothetical protein
MLTMQFKFTYTALDSSNKLETLSHYDPRVRYVIGFNEDGKFRVDSACSDVNDARRVVEYMYTLPKNEDADIKIYPLTPVVDLELTKVQSKSLRGAFFDCERSESHEAVLTHNMGWQLQKAGAVEYKRKARKGDYAHYSLTAAGRAYGVARGWLDSVFMGLPSFWVGIAAIARIEKAKEDNVAGLSKLWRDMPAIVALEKLRDYCHLGDDWVLRFRYGWNGFSISFIDHSVGSDGHRYEWDALTIKVTDYAKERRLNFVTSYPSGNGTTADKLHEFAFLLQTGAHMIDCMNLIEDYPQWAALAALGRTL